MPMQEHTTTMTLGYSATGEHYLLNEPNDIVFPGTNYPDNRRPLWPDVGEPGRVLSSQFDLRDKVLISHVRVNCPFARGLLVEQAEMVAHVYGTYGQDTVQPGENWPNLRLDLSAPWGEWTPINQFVYFNNLNPSPANTTKTIFALLEPLTVLTKGLDPIWNGQDWRLEIDLRIKHLYPLGDPIDYRKPPKVQNLVLTPFAASMRLDWDTDPISSSYDIYMQTLALPEVLLATKQNVGPGTYGALGLTTGQSYTFRVVPHSFGGYGPSSDPKTAIAG